MLVSLAEALAFLPERALHEDEARAVRHGTRVGVAGSTAPYARLTHDGALLAIGELRGGELQPVVVFEPA
jgi:hypothetical protein